MILTKRSALQLLGKLPFVGKWAQLEHYNQLLSQFDEVQRGYGSAKVRFIDSVTLLYDALLEVSADRLVEDFNWFYTLELSVYTRTSGEAHRLLDGLMRGNPVKVEDHFRSHGVGSKVPLMEWYSSGYTTELFFTYGANLVRRYCEQHAEQLSPEQAKMKKTSFNPPLDAFLASKHFKMLTEDLIAIARLIVQSQLRVLNGEAKEKPQG
jgi:hypothetical protein